METWLSLISPVSGIVTWVARTTDEADRLSCTFIGPAAIWR